jgi:hypothetical protein
MSSNFENLPLPVTKDSQDYVRLVPAGRTVEIPVVGDFIYCKFSDGEIRVVINGKSTNMESGDERRSGEGTVFRGVNLINDTGVDKYVVFVIGFGGFDRKIIQGEVSIEPILRNADGSVKPDTRQTLSIDLTPSKTKTRVYETGDVIQLADRPGDTIDEDGINVDISSGYVVKARGGTALITKTSNGNFYEGFILYFDAKLNFYDFDFLTYFGNSQSPQLIGADCVAYTLKSGFLYSKGSNRKLFKYTGQDSAPVVAFEYPETTSTDRIKSITEYNGGVVLFVNNLAIFLDENNNLVKQISLPFDVDVFSKGVTYDESNNRFVYSPSTGKVDFYDENFVLISEGQGTASANSLFANTGFYVIGNNLYAFDARVGVWTIRKSAVETYETKPEIRAILPGCDLASAITVPRFIPQINAQVEFFSLEGGSSLGMSGEVIKAVLEYYFKRSVPSDYLDHVYTFDMGLDSDFTNFVPISSGNRSFLAFGIEDDFSTSLPNKFTVTIADTLKFGDFL